MLLQKEMSSLSRSSPHTSRVGSSLAKSTIQETSFTTSPTPMETEATVTRINQMFPTANENHIRMLLKKWVRFYDFICVYLRCTKKKSLMMTKYWYFSPVSKFAHLWKVIMIRDDWRANQLTNFSLSTSLSSYSHNENPSNILEIPTWIGLFLKNENMLEFFICFLQWKTPQHRFSFIRIWHEFLLITLWFYPQNDS